MHLICSKFFGSNILTETIAMTPVKRKAQCRPVVLLTPQISDMTYQLSMCTSSRARYSSIEPNFTAKLFFGCVCSATYCLTFIKFYQNISFMRKEKAFISCSSAMLYWTKICDINYCSFPSAVSREMYYASAVIFSPKMIFTYILSAANFFVQLFWLKPLLWHL